MSQDKKISELATAPTFDGTEKIAVVKNGITYVGTLSNLLTYISGQDITFSGNITHALGKKLNIVAGTNQRAGNVDLTAGTVTVANTTITANSVIVLGRKTIGGTAGNLSYTINAGVGFTINSSSGTDTSRVSYIIVEVV